ncbi:MAG TPA: AAA family ATPase [Rhodospirillaceae bacterium]|nr:AAA family ATPase [Rhodospirillaceae bacterium]
MSAENDQLVLLLRSLRLSSMAQLVPESLEIAKQENWSHVQWLRYLCEQESEQRLQRRMQNLLKASHLPDSKTLGNLKENLLPQKIRRLLPELLDGTFVQEAKNILCFGLPGRGKTHFLCALGRELILRHQYRVFFTPAFKLVNQLLEAKRDLKLPALLSRFDNYQVVILDELGYIQQSREEMEALFTFLAERYERRTIMISSNLVFSQWDQIFKNPITAAAAVDKLVHHAHILEFTGKSQRMPTKNNGSLVSHE